MRDARLDAIAPSAMQLGGVWGNRVADATAVMKRSKSEAWPGNS